MAESTTKDPGLPLDNPEDQDDYESKVLEFGVGEDENLFSRNFRPGSVKASTLTLICATLGVGMLSMPRSFHESGIVLCSLLLYAAALVSYISIVCLIRISSFTGLTNYSDLAVWSYGRKFKAFSDVIFFANNFGTCMTYSIVIKENFAKSFKSIQENWWSGLPDSLTEQRSCLWIIVAQGMLIPLILKEKLTELRWFSLGSFIIILYIGVAIIANCFTNEYTKNVDQKLEELRLSNPSGLSVSLPIFIFGFTCQQNVLNCFRELREPTVRRMKKVVSRQIFIASAIYLSVGCFGYLTFGNNFSATEENILTKYKESNLSVFVGTLLLILSIIFAQPYNVFPTREALHMWVRPGKPATGLSLKLVSLFTHVSQATIASVSVLNDIPMDKMLDYVSGCTSATMCFTIPFLFYYKMIRDDPAKALERRFYLSLIVLFIAFQILKILSFILPEYFKWLG